MTRKFPTPYWLLPISLVTLEKSKLRDTLLRCLVTHPGTDRCKTLENVLDHFTLVVSIKKLQAMSVVEKNWQTTKPSIRERSKFIFNNDLFSDVKFVVRKMDGESESKQVIPAHKFVLSISSPVFEAMFYGELSETRDSIELPDCEYESLLQLFRYMYSDEVSLSGSNVMGVLYLAKKYMVPSLADKCSEYLQENLDPSNVFNILPSAEKYEEESLVDGCWKVIDEQTEEALKSNGFATIERSLLEAVVIRDTLTIEEIELFKAVDLWATKKCERQGLEADGKTKRRILGEEIVKAIRFPIMKQEDFASVVLDSKILTPDEIVTIVKYLNSVLSSPVGFPEERRLSAPLGCGDIQRCFRFGSYRNFSREEYEAMTSRVIEFSVDRNIILHGVYVCGQADILSCQINLTLLNTRSNFANVMMSEQFSIEDVTCHAFAYWGYKILFNRAVPLRKNTTYRLKARTSGTIKWCGQNIINPVTCSGVTFTFKSISGEDFPELLFSL